MTISWVAPSRSTLLALAAEGEVEAVRPRLQTHGRGDSQQRTVAEPRCRELNPLIPRRVRLDPHAARGQRRRVGRGHALELKARTPVRDRSGGARSAAKGAGAARRQAGNDQRERQPCSRRPIRRLRSESLPCSTLDSDTIRPRRRAQGRRPARRGSKGSSSARRRSRCRSGREAIRACRAHRSTADTSRRRPRRIRCSRR